MAWRYNRRDNGRDYERVCRDRGGHIRYHLVYDDELAVRNGVQCRSGLLLLDGEHGSGYIRSFLGAGDDAPVYTVRLGIVRCGRGRSGVRFRHRIPKRQGEYPLDGAERPQRLFCLFAHRHRSDRIV